MSGQEIVEVWVKIGENSFYLHDSAVISKNSKQLIAAHGAILLTTESNVVKFLTYATFNSPIHNLTASPAETIYKNASSWIEQGQSNGFDIEAKSILLPVVEGKYKVETEFKISDEYTGPKYKKRIVTFMLGIPIPVKVEMEYLDGKKDVGIIEHQPNGDLKITWQFQFGPNLMNVNFF